MDGETMKIPKDFILGGSKIIGDCDCSHEIKRRLLLGMKVMTNLDSILKNRYITLPAKVHLVKAMVFPEVMTGKTAEHGGIDAFIYLFIYFFGEQGPHFIFQSSFYTLSYA